MAEDNVVSVRLKFTELIPKIRRYLANEECNVLTSALQRLLSDSDDQIVTVASDAQFEIMNSGMLPSQLEIRARNEELLAQE